MRISHIRADLGIDVRCSPRQRMIQLIHSDAMWQTCKAVTFQLLQYPDGTSSPSCDVEPQTCIIWNPTPPDQDATLHEPEFHSSAVQLDGSTTRESRGDYYAFYTLAFSEFRLNMDFGGKDGSRLGF
jgi:hypothetical protein